MATHQYKARLLVARMCTRRDTLLGETAACHAAQVVVFRPDATVDETKETSEGLGLAPRDVSLFAPRPAGVSSQRATISPRDGAVLVRTEIAKAVIKRNAAYLFPCTCACPAHANLSLHSL
jgi:hypothetical protein